MDRGGHRKIIHIDMDAFYASVEQRDFPEYRGKPLVVGGLPEGRGGVVAAASYEARKFGIHSAMPSKIAHRLCPQAIFVRPRFDVYKTISGQLHEIFHRYTDLVEPLSLDEAYLDVTVDKQGIGYAMEIAKRIKREVREELQLTASAGVSINKFVAKIASDIDKPDGLTFIGPSRIEQFIARLPVEKFYGVGKVTAAKMKSIGLFTGADLRKLSLPAMTRHFGKTGKFFYGIVRGIDNRPVQPDREIKSVSVEDTYPEDLIHPESILRELEILTDRLIPRLESRSLRGRTVTLKFKFHDFSLMTRSLSSPLPLEGKDEVFAVVRQLFNNNEATLAEHRIRLLGVGISNFHRDMGDPELERGGYQLRLFEDDAEP